MSKCTRCGKDRIVKSSYTEKLDKSTIVHTETVCPDPDCQALVDKGLLVEENKRKAMHEEQEKRAQDVASERKNLKKANFA